MTQKNLILIMARASGTKEISRQNLRLVNEKPLIFYVINTALKCPSATVFVSTDSEEIKELALMYGAQVIDRPEELTKDSTTIESIAYDALSKLAKKNMDFEKCLILHPHFPLIKLSTINKFFLKLNDTISTIFGYEPPNHDNYVKIYNKNFNLPTISTTTRNLVKLKKIISFDCRKFLVNKTFQTPYYGIELSKDELFTPNNYHDFAALEKIIKRKRILVRVDGDRKIGLGHVYNMLTILNYLRDEEILIVMNQKKKMGSNKFKEHLYKIKYFSNNSQLFNIINSFKPDIIFNDVLDTAINYMKNLKKFSCFIVNFEDLGKGRKLADLVFNPIYFPKKPLSNEFSGPNYACVRDEFRIWKSNPIKKNVKNVIISFGGTDPTNKTLNVLQIIKNSNLRNITFTVILGLGYAYTEMIKNLVAQMRLEGFKINIVEKSDFLAQHIKNSDFAIVSNGRTVFEIAAMKVPLIAISVNKREQQHSFVKHSNIGLHLDLTSKSNYHKLISYINKMINFSTRKKFMRNLQQINLLDGVERVIRKIFSEYEKNQLLADCDIKKHSNKS